MILVNCLIYLLAVLGLHCFEGFSLVAASRAYSLVGMRGLLLRLSSGSRALGLQWLQHVASVVVAPGLLAQ